MPETNQFNAMPAAFYHAILNSIEDPFNIIDRNYRIVWANEARARFHRQKLPNLIGKFCYEMFQCRSKPCLECPVRVVFDSGKPCVMEKCVVLPDGSLKYGDIRAYPVFDSEGSVAYAIQIMFDITKRRLRTSRQRRYVEALETTVRELNGKDIRGLLRHEGGEIKKKLTERETQVLGLIANGYSNIEIGKALAISPHTVKTHVRNVFGKLGVTDRTQAATWAVRHKLF